MKAALIEALNQPLVVKKIAPPTATAGRLVVQLYAAALNHRDVWIQKGRYPGIKLPIVLGSDGAGVVTAVGDGVNNEWLGKEVIINAGQHWGTNERFYGPDFKILGMPDDGTFAEYLQTELAFLATKPAHLSFEEAAALPLAGLTGWRALMTRAALQPAERVLVTGVGGGVALFVLQFAIATGAEVWVTSGSDEKIAKAVAMGATGGINYKNPDWPKQLLAATQSSRSGYFDVIIDSAGGAGFASLIDVAAPGGRICFFGGTTGNITDLVPGKIFFKQLSILGSTMGSDREFAAMLAFVEKYRIRPVVDKIFALDEAENALKYMERGTQFGKIVLKIKA